MSWQADNLSEVDSLIYRGQYSKVGRFQCSADHPDFGQTPAIDNDVLVIPTNPIWVSRNRSEFWYSEPGSFLLHGAGSELARRYAGGMGDDTIWFAIHPEAFEEVLLDNEWCRDSLGGSSMLSPGLRLKLALLYRDINTGDLDSAELDERILGLFQQVCAERAGRSPGWTNTSSKTTERHRRLVERARAYIDEREFDELDLDAIASAVGSSAFHLCRIFKKIMGISLHDYRTQRRLGFVLDQLLGEEKVSLSQLALDAGFSSHSHMTRVFTRYYGCSPSKI